MPSGRDTASSSLPAPRPTVAPESLVALALTARRLFAIYMFLPALTMASPVVLTVASWVLNLLTQNHAILSVLLTVTMTSACRDIIVRSAPTRKKASEALAKCQVTLPLFIFVLSAIVINMCIAPLGAFFEATHFLTWSPRISVFVACRFAAGMGLLGLSLLLRYLGPNSVVEWNFVDFFVEVRCSSSPLQSHGGSLWVRTLRTRLSSINEFAEFVTRPSEKMLTARRHQSPDFFCLIAQAVVSLVVGLAVAYSSVLPLCSRVTHGDSSNKATLMVTCVVSVLVHLVVTAFDGSSHELNPKKYTIPNTTSSPISYHKKTITQSIVTLRVPPLLKVTFSSATMVLVAAITLSGSVNGGPTIPSRGLVLACFFTITLVSTYLYVIDEITRALLCNPGIDVRRQVAETLGSTSMLDTLDVIMHSILHSDSSLVATLYASTDTPSEFKEAEAKMAKHLRFGNREDAGWYFEKDILRYAILESFGGTSQQGIPPAGVEAADTRHSDWIKCWVQSNAEVDWTRGAAPLVRSFCAYAGGLGEALVQCAGDTSPPSRPLSNGHERQQEQIRMMHAVHFSLWVLPPGAVVCAEYAISAATRFVVLNFRNTSRPFVDWKSTQLSMLVPAVIKAAFHLQTGIVAYSRSRSAVGTRNYADPFEMIKAENPELIAAFCACNNAALTILQELQALEGARSVAIDFDSDCNMWIKGLLDRH